MTTSLVESTQEQLKTIETEVKETSKPPSVTPTLLKRIGARKMLLHPSITNKIVAGIRQAQRSIASKQASRRR